MNFVPVLSSIVTLVFTVLVFQRYQKKGGSHLLFWAIGLLLYALGTLSEVFMAARYSAVVLKIWYLSGAMLTAAWLGQGSLQLLFGGKSWAKPSLFGLILLSVISIYLIAIAPTSDPAKYQVALTVSEQYKEFLTRGGFVTFLTIVLNIYGTIWLVGGAGYSAFLFWRKQVLADRMFGNILICVGALAPASAGTFVKMGLTDMLYVSELVGAILMFAGFLLSTARKN